MQPSNEQRALLFALGAVLLWSTVATAFKLSLQYLAPVQLLAWASLFSLLTLGLLLVATGRLTEVLRGSRRDSLRSLALGLLNPLCYYLVLFEAYDRLPAQEAQPLNYTWAFTLALGSTVPWVLYWIYSTRDQRDPLVALFCNFALGLPFVLLACALTAGLSVPSWQGLAGAAWVGVFEMGLAFALWLSALKLTKSASRISNLVFLSPFLSLFFIRAFVGETILPSTWVGLGFIVAGLAVQQGFRPHR